MKKSVVTILSAIILTVFMLLLLASCGGEKSVVAEAGKPSLSDAIAQLSASGGTVKIKGRYEIEENFEEPLHEGKITLTGANENAVLYFAAPGAAYNLSGDTVFQNLKIETAAAATVFARYNSLEMGEGVVIGDGDTAVMSLFGGRGEYQNRDAYPDGFDYSHGTNISVRSGRYVYICGGNRGAVATNETIAGVCNIALYDGVCADYVVGGSVGGTTNILKSQIELFGGRVTSSVAGGSGNEKYIVDYATVVIHNGFDLDGSFTAGAGYDKDGRYVGITGDGLAGSKCISQRGGRLYVAEETGLERVAALSYEKAFTARETFAGDVFTAPADEYNIVEQTPQEALRNVGTIASITDLNTEEDAINSHEATAIESVLEKNFRANISLNSKITGTESPFYARVKKTKSGEYIAIYQGHLQLDSDIYILHSKDLKTFTDLDILFPREATFAGSTNRRYATADAVVLDDGTIIASACFRSGKKEQDTKGLVIRRSYDGGYTWTEIQQVYTGRCWEPSLLELPSGEVQIYFTHSAPYFALYGDSIPRVNSGTALLRSFDGGLTFSPYIWQYPNEAYRIIQQYATTLEGKKYYTGQMPVAILLNNTNRIAVALESKDGNDSLGASIAYSDDNWATEIGINEEGPETIKEYFVKKVSAPYIAQFRSGETLFSCGSDYQLYIGDALAENFNMTPYRPFYEKGENGYGGSIEIISDHTALLAFTTTKYKDDYEDNKLLFVQMQLNHTIGAKKATVALDADHSDWENNTDALFVGSDSQAQVSVRFGYDDDNMYILSERLDRTITAGDATEIYFTPSDDNDYNDRTYRVVIDSEGAAKLEKYENGAYVAAGEISAKSLVNTQGERDEYGILTEIAIPRALIDGLSGGVKTNIMLRNNDGGAAITDALKGLTLFNHLYWIGVIFE